mmetsp:Transcript_1560/g.4279  ORF Transcript_1560/g.4279 Transcript_1560/m.4279 type:complete len:457 (-) Transcript_1560:312-1682(-)
MKKPFHSDEPRFIEPYEPRQLWWSEPVFVPLPTGFKESGEVEAPPGLEGVGTLIQKTTRKTFRDFGEVVDPERQQPDEVTQVLNMEPFQPMAHIYPALKGSIEDALQEVIVDRLPDNLPPELCPSGSQLLQSQAAQLAAAAKHAAWWSAETVELQEQGSCSPPQPLGSAWRPDPQLELHLCDPPPPGLPPPQECWAMGATDHFDLASIAKLKMDVADHLATVRQAEALLWQHGFPMEPYHFRGMPTLDWSVAASAFYPVFSDLAEVGCDAADMDTDLHMDTDLQGPIGCQAPAEDTDLHGLSGCQTPDDVNPNQFAWEMLASHFTDHTRSRRSALFHIVNKNTGLSVLCSAVITARKSGSRQYEQGFQKAGGWGTVEVRREEALLAEKFEVEISFAVGIDERGPKKHDFAAKAQGASCVLPEGQAEWNFLAAVDGANHVTIRITVDEDHRVVPVED